MTGKHPTIFTFKPHESHAAQMQNIFVHKGNYHLRYVDSALQIVQALEQEGAEIDAIIVPFVLEDRTPGLTACLQLRAQEEIGGIPVVAVATGKDSAAISTMYGAGADVVLVPPLEAGLVHVQLSALKRYRQSFKEELKAGARDFGLRQAMVSALHFVEDSLIILDAGQDVVFINRAARNLLKIYTGSEPQQSAALIEPIARSVRAEIAAGRVSSEMQALPSLQVVLKRADGSEFSADVRITSLRAADERVIAYGAAIHDLTMPREITATLVQVERLNSLSLMMAAACHHLLNTDSLGLPGKGMARVESLLAMQHDQAPLLPVVTAMLEFLDLILSSRTSLKVKMPKEFTIAMKPADLFRLSGHLVIYAVKFAGHKGEISISAAEGRKAGSVNLVVGALGDSEIFNAKVKQTAALIRSKFLGLKGGETTQEKLNQPHDALYFDARAAQEIAGRYGLELREEHPTDQELVVTVNLPLFLS